MQYIDVVIENKSQYTDNFYTYSAPDDVRVGGRVEVPFARQKKALPGYCVRTRVTPSFDASKIKEIADYYHERSLNEEMVDTALWMRKRYGVKYIDALKMFEAPGKRPAKKEEDECDGTFDPGYSLSDEQKKAADKICKAVRTEKFKAFLIKGVTNSGKTEVYINAAKEALSKGKSVIVLLPEIALAEQVAERFRERFGASMVATLHSRLKGSERLREWLRIKSGEARIVVGPRTSVFAPLDNIGLIVIDEEHEGTYKSDHNPKYETVDIAYKRASYSDAVLVLGSATPGIVSYYRAKTGLYELICMDERIGSSEMPELETVDMRKENLKGNFDVLSNQLKAEIDNTLKAREQVILFLNRRGFSTQVLCPDCGYKMTCDDCGITLTYHKSSNALVCHYCGKKQPLPEVCPKCGSKFIKYIGAGTEKVEERVRQIWPEVKVARFDLDTAADTGDSSKVIKDFQSGKTDILVGTQILAKGLDFKRVGLVGIINADVSLNIPDYRSSERTYQLITQVAGRAGRTGGKSRVLIQTYEPESDVIKEAAAGDYDEFYEAEILHRALMNYPPYTDIISVGFASDKEETAMAFAEKFRKRLMALKEAPEGAQILKIRMDERRPDDKARAVFVIKAPQGSRAGYLQEYMEFRDRMIESKADCFIEIDVNPYGII